MKHRLITMLGTLLACCVAFAEGETFIGELTAPESGITFTTETFLSRSIKALAPAFKFGEKYAVEINKIYDSGVDIVFHLSEACFLDHVSFEIGSAADGAMVQVFADGKPITEAVTLAAGENTVVPAWYSDNFTFRFYKDVRYLETAALETVRKDYKAFTVEGMKLFGAAKLGNVIYPFPQKLEYTGGWLENITGVKAPKNELAATDFMEKFEGRFGVRLAAAKKGNIVFEIDKKLGKEEFTLDVMPAGAKLCGGSSRALFYGAEKLLQLTSDGGRIKCASIQDSPAFPFRGIHAALPGRVDFDFMRRVVKYVYAPMGYNTIFLEIKGTMEYKRHPEINKANCANPEDVISQDEVRDLCAYIRSYGIDVIPLLQSFGHVQFVTRAHPELGEQAEIKQEENIFEADKRSNIKDFHTACPNHPDYFPLFFDLWDEVIDVVKPDRYVNIGHDEIYELGQCPLCKAEGGANVYAREVTTIHDYITKKGYGVMMWSDMITEKRYASTASIDMIPKDIICLPFTWYFHLSEEGDSEKPLVEHGFKYMIGNLYSSHFQDFAKKRENPGFLGGEVSYWQRCEETAFGYQGKFYDFAYTANMLWNLSYRDDMRRTYNEIVRDLLPRFRQEVHYGRLQDEKEIKAYVPEGDNVPYDLKGSFATAAAAGADGDAVVPLDGVKADRLHVVHATDYHAVEGQTLRPVQAPSGAYVFDYVDGTTAEEPLIYGYTLGWCRWAFGAPRRSSTFRHYGYVFTYPSAGVSLKAADGSDATVWDYALDNPHPEKAVKALRIRFDGKNASKLLVFSVRACTL